MKCRYMYTRIILVAVLSPTIKIFHRHLGPNLYISAVKFSQWFHRHFMTYHRHFTTKKHRPRWFLAKMRCACCMFNNVIWWKPSWISDWHKSIHFLWESFMELSSHDCFQMIWWTQKNIFETFFFHLVPC
jgi:hypothetical protein